MHQYQIRYIEREGVIDTRYVLAKDPSDAKRVAEEEGCEDILSVKRVAPIHFPVLFLVAVIVFLVALAVICRLI